LNENNFALYDTFILKRKSKRRWRSLCCVCACVFVCACTCPTISTSEPTERISRSLVRALCHWKNHRTSTFYAPHSV